jgi:hypothetical protein
MRLASCLLLICLSPALVQAQVVSDRPDAAEGTTVLPRGAFQVEAGLAIERDRSREYTRSTPTLLRYGAFETVELRLETEGRLSAPAAHGMADMAVGAKWHLMDGENGEPAIALVGNIALATGARAFRGQGSRPSLLLATEWELSPDMSLSLMPGLVRDADDSGNHFVAGILAISLDKEWTEEFHSFIELSAPQIARTRYGGTQATVNAGVTYAVSKQLQLDTAVFRGLNKRTADLYWTVGLSTRF